jgi:hypothetical protein
LTPPRQRATILMIIVGFSLRDEPYGERNALRENVWDYLRPPRLEPVAQRLRILFAPG